MTVSKEHAKWFSVFENKWLRDNLKISSSDLGKSGVGHIHVFYALLPFIAQSLKTVKVMKPSFAWTPAADAKKVENATVTFGLLAFNRTLGLLSSQDSYVI